MARAWGTDREARPIRAGDEGARPHQHPAAADGSAGEIGRLAALRDRGVITAAEFQVKMKRK